MKTAVLLSLLLLVIDGSAEPTRVEQNQPVCTNTITTVNAVQPHNEVWPFFANLFDTSLWPKRWECGYWSSFHGWLYISSDLIIWLSYFLIPLTLGYFVYRRKEDPIPFKSVVFLFIAFILGCGLTHLVDAATFWWPAYRLSAFIRLLTATVSLATVFALIRIAPKVMELKSPAVLEQMVNDRTTELIALNALLKAQAKQREEAEQQLKKANRELEQKTLRLEATNDRLLQRERELIASDAKFKLLNQELEQKVSERTQALHGINQELEAFTYSVSHDLRAPLRAIDGYARILEEDYNPRLDAHGKHLIAVITKNALFMGQLIDDLLDFSRTSRSEIVKSRFEADKEVRRIASELMALEKNRNVGIDIHPLENSSGDMQMLRQVWTNLISNALKYTRKTELAKIEIQSRRTETEVEYIVKDNGVGFEMEYVGKLFGVFQRLHRKDQFEGTGVGLALVKRILDRHNGRVWAHAEPGKGATFHFTLPL